VEKMKNRGICSIVFLTSDCTFLPKFNAVAHTESRYVLKCLSDSLRIDLFGSGVEVHLAVFGKVSGTYWENNPGSEHMVRKAIPLMPTLTTKQVSQDLVKLVEKRKRIIAKPTIFIILFWLYHHYPDFMGKVLKSRTK
jgi:short-subunit dehydrogenase